MEITNTGICVEGFKAYGTRKGKYGISLIVSDVPTNSSVMITSNRVIAAPLLLTTKHSKTRNLQGIVANSGCANAFTGDEGLSDAKEMQIFASNQLGINPKYLGVASTGVIGQRLDMNLIRSLIQVTSKDMQNNNDASIAASKAIMTTDSNHKSISVKTRLNSGKVIELGGIAKGTGMIAPDLHHATMLCFLTTNAYIPKEKIDKILKEAVDQSFNVSTVDGDTSTNDMVILFANGHAKNVDIDDNFQEALNFLTCELAKMLVRDAEGGTKLIEIQVLNAKDKGDALKAGRAIASSNLVKTALFGENPNWGRIIAAAGYSGANSNPSNISLSLSGGNIESTLVEGGKIRASKDSDELERAKQLLKKNEIKIILNLHNGRKNATLYGCDMGYDYIKINAEYST